ncbi:MAG: S4 domain-containing protein [Christensenellales bacterium]
MYQDAHFPFYGRDPRNREGDASRINEKKELLAFELTKLVHGDAEANKCRETSLALFGGGGDDANMPSTVFTAEKVGDGIILVDLLAECGLCASKGEGRRLIQQGGVSVNGEKITDFAYVITPAMLADGVKIRKAKRFITKPRCKNRFSRRKYPWTKRNEAGNPRSRKTRPPYRKATRYRGKAGTQRG